MQVFDGAKQAKELVLGRFFRCELGMMVPVEDLNWGIIWQHSIFKSQGVIPSAISK